MNFYAEVKKSKKYSELFIKVENKTELHDLWKLRFLLKFFIKKINNLMDDNAEW